MAANAADFAARGSRAFGHRATTLPGVVAERLSPSMVTRIADTSSGVVVVSGTNGKTTTTGLIVGLLQNSGVPVVTNPSGANLLAGVSSTLISHRRQLKDRPAPVLVLEVDEMSLDRVAKLVPIQTLVMTNLARDQLDRYGETEAIVKRWRAVLARLDESSTLVVCADDARLMHLISGARGKVLTFGLDGPPPPSADPLLTPETFTCPVCDGVLDRPWTGLGHLGDFRCRTCGFTREQPWVGARVIHTRGFAGTDIDVRVGVTYEERSLALQLPGVSNVYNAAAALAAVASLNVPGPSPAHALGSLRAPWGRYESVFLDGREVVLALGKNPASVAELVRIGAEADVDAILVGVNDAIADGRDASWYWDVDLWPMLANRAVILTGTRRHDLALRLKYAAGARGDGSWSPNVLIDDPAEALTALVEQSKRGARILAVLTYTALLDLRSSLAARRLVSPVPA